jgi:hypothetical protein
LNCAPEHTTPEFSLAEPHSTLLTIGNKYGAIDAGCRTSISETLLTLSSYTKGTAPVQLINHTTKVMVEFTEKAIDAKQFLGPQESTLYTWRQPDGQRYSFCFRHLYCTLKILSIYKRTNCRTISRANLQTIKPKRKEKI